MSKVNEFGMNYKGHVIHVLPVLPSKATRFSFSNGIAYRFVVNGMMSYGDYADIPDAFYDAMLYVDEVLVDTPSDSVLAKVPTDAG